MANENGETEEGYDPRTDPDSPHYDPDYDPDADPWNDPDYDPFENDYDPDTGLPRPDPESGDDEKVCIPTDCEIVEIEEGWCCYVCAGSCSDGAEVTMAFCNECDDEGSE